MGHDRLKELLTSKMTGDKKERFRQATQRVFDYIDVKGIKDSDFAASIGVSRQHVSVWRTGKGNISSNTFIKVIDAYKDLSMEWLVYGEGKMIVNPDHSENRAENGFLMKIDQLGTQVDILLKENEIYLEHIQFLRGKVAYLEKVNKGLTEDMSQ